MKNYYVFDNENGDTSFRVEYHWDKYGSHVNTWNLVF